MKKIISTTLLLTVGLSIACGSAATEKIATKNESAKPSPTVESKVENKNKETKSETEKTEQTAESNDTSRKSVSGKEVTGTFQMKFTNEDLEATNEIKIAALGDNKLKIEFDLAYPFRINNERSSVNIGKAQGEATIEGDTAIYSTKDDKGSCEIKIKFVKPGLIKVSQIQAGSGCGFGLNVSARGTYKKVSDDKPSFSSNN